MARRVMAMMPGVPRMTRHEASTRGPWSGQKRGLGRLVARYAPLAMPRKKDRSLITRSHRDRGSAREPAITRRRSRGLTTPPAEVRGRVEAARQNTIDTPGSIVLCISDRPAGRPIGQSRDFRNARRFDSGGNLSRDLPVINSRSCLL